MPGGDELPRSISYIPYGEIFVEESDNKGVPPYRFNAKELDEETGLYYYGARYLDPTSVGWLSVDPLFEKYVGMSPYNYCAGNPVKLVDTDGRVIKLGGVIYSPGSTTINDASNNFERAAINAMNYLYEHRSELMNSVFQTLSQSNQVFQVYGSNESGHVMSGIIVWCPTDGYISDNGTKLTPANGLYHELAHRYQLYKYDLLVKKVNRIKSKLIRNIGLRIANRKYEKMMSGKNPDIWGNNNDEITVKKYETDAAIQCGEFKPTKEHPYTRDKYKGKGARDVKTKNETTQPE